MTNVIVLEGNLVADSVTKNVAETTVTEFKIANNRFISRGKEKTLFMHCQWWGARGVAVSSYLTKGKRVTISGALESDQWTGEDGQPRSKMSIVVSDLSLGPSRMREGGGKQEYGDEQLASNSGDALDKGEGFNDDIPF